MKTQLILITLLSLAAVGLYFQNDSTTTLEAQKPTGIDIDNLYCYYGGVLWRLENVDLTNNDILEMVKVMDSGYLTELCQVDGHDVEEVFFYLNHNTSLTDFSPLLDGINRNFSNTIYNIQMDFGFNQMENWDKNFENWQIPEKVTQVVFSFKDDQSTSISNFTNAVVSQGKIEDFYLDVTHNNVNGKDITQLVRAIQDHEAINSKIQLYLGYNLEGDTDANKLAFLDIIKNSPNLHWIDLWLQDYKMTENYLQQLSDVIYNQKVNGKLADVSLNLQGCGIPSETVRAIFKKPLDKFGFRFHLLL